MYSLPSINGSVEILETLAFKLKIPAPTQFFTKFTPETKEPDVCAVADSFCFAVGTSSVILW